MDLASAKAVITGGASGLGLATAERVIAAGGQVVVLDVNEEQGNTSVAKLAPTGSIMIPSHFKMGAMEPVGRTCRSSGPMTVGPVTERIAPNSVDTAQPRPRT